MEWSFSSSSPAPAPSTEKHDVFLSFRGEDTRNTFASHLHAALRRQQIKTYVDYSLQRGQEISPALVQAIEGAKVSEVIFSKNYAASRGCLDELAKIVECKLKQGQIIVPVFYHVSPSHVQNQTGSYGDAFAEHEREFEHSMNKVQRWRVALAAAAKQNGWDCSPNRVEAEVVEKIAEDVVKKLEGVERGGLEEKIAAHKQMAQAKLEKSLRTGNLNDIEDLTMTLKELAQLKLEKVLRTDDANDWEELNTTHQRILQLKQEKFIRTCNPRDLEDLAATERHIAHIEAEKQNRMRGLYRGL